ncbi:MAG: hypothetical protein P4K80_06960 [Acidobacteriaceae bacterium]|nr:hypothetical protein [Acidobacteriaceae bacterium]
MTVGELDIIAPTMENTTPPATKARKILRPLPFPDGVDALEGSTELGAADGLLVLEEYWRL